VRAGAIRKDVIDTFSQSKIFKNKTNRSVPNNHFFTALFHLSSISFEREQKNLNQFFMGLRRVACRLSAVFTVDVGRGR
jgi:hypothetical protein